MDNSKNHFLTSPFKRQSILARLCSLLLMRSLPESFPTSPAPRPWSPALRQHRSLTGGPLRPEIHLATSFHDIQVSHMVVCFCFLTQSCPPKKNGSVFRSKPPKKTLWPWQLPNCNFLVLLHVSLMLWLQQPWLTKLHPNATREMGLPSNGDVWQGCQIW